MRDHKTSSICQRLISSGNFGNKNKYFPVDKATFLLDQLEIGKRKYIEFKKLLKSENIIFPPYQVLSNYRSQITLSNEFQIVYDNSDHAIGIQISYQKIIQQSLSRLLKTIPLSNTIQFPISVRISDGLDGSGCHQIYNQLQSANFNNKNFILFAFKILSIKDSTDKQIWVNKTPNSDFQIRPVALLAMKETEVNVKFIMESHINPETTKMENDGIELIQGHCEIKVLRTMFDGKMSGILTGAGGAKCQLCTASFKEIHDLEFITTGFPINRTIKAAKEIFSDVDRDEFLALPSQARFGLTHEPISDIDVISASPLHSYTCVFRWFMLLIYHLHSGSKKWQPTSSKIQTSLKFVREFLQEKTGLKIDQPSSSGGTTSTGNIARQCFHNKNDFIRWIETLIPQVYHDPIRKIQCNISAILRIFSCAREINTDQLDVICRETYKFILTNFPWANISPSLHKLLAHSAELIKECNEGYGLKELSEEGVESCNKLIRRYRDHLARKNSFNVNTRDIFIRLLSHSDPQLVSFRKFIRCSNCGELSNICKLNCRTANNENEQEKLFNSLLSVQLIDHST